MRGKLSIVLFGIGCAVVGGVVGAGSFGLALAQGKPQPAQPATVASPWERVLGGSVQARTAEEQSFTDKTKKFGWESLRDTRNGAMVYVVAESGALAVGPGPKGYELRLNPAGASYNAVKFHPTKGGTFMLEGDKWKPVAEAGAVSAGDYDVQLITFADNKMWAALRMERLSGKTWYVKEGKWQELGDTK